MPNRNYRRGRAYEYKVKKQLEKKGWTVLRTAGSHGEFDLIAIKRKEIEFTDIPLLGKIKLIQCKTGKTKKRMILEVERTNIAKRFDGWYSVKVEVL